MRSRLGALALALAFAALSTAQSLTPAERQANVDSFEQVWKTVRDKHWDPHTNGVDWQAVHDELRPKLDQATTMEQARAIMSDMIARLKQTHFEILPGEAYAALDQKDDSGKSSPSEGDPGLDLRVIDGHALVTSVEPGSPAAAKGVKMGWELLQVDGKPLQPTIQKLHSAMAESTMLAFYQTHSVLGRLAGPLDKTVDVQFLDGQNKKVAVKLPRTAPRGAETVLGQLPPVHFWLDSHKVAGDIGYVRFNMFFEPDAVAEAMQKMVADCTACQGFVIDLRGNPGGIGGMAMGLAGWFTNQSGLMLGTMHMRSGSIKFAVFRRAQPFRGPLAILVDGNSASTSEIFAGGMQDLKRARIFGVHTAGAALPSMFERLPNGDGFQYAIANYISTGGKPLEGLGVTPDEQVQLTRPQLLAGHDSQLDAAVDWIHKQ